MICTTGLTVAHKKTEKRKRANRKMFVRRSFPFAVATYYSPPGKKLKPETVRLLAD